MGAGSRERVESCAVEQEGVAGRGRKVARWGRKGAESCAVGQEGRQGEGGKLRGGAGRGGRERAAAVQITLAIFGGGW